MHDNHDSEIQPVASESDFLHDLSSPLTVILGALESLEMNLEKITDQKSVDRVQRALSSLRKLIAMINDRKVVVRKLDSGK